MSCLGQANAFIIAPSCSCFHLLNIANGGEFRFLTSGLLWPERDAHSLIKAAQQRWPVTLVPSFWRNCGVSAEP
jgi:hypothetical protein